MNCTCDKWKDNINKLNSGFILQYIQDGSGYDGEQFLYCPWCGKVLVKEGK